MSRLRRYLSAPRRYNRSKGFGIHSPFAFDFVTSTLRERCRYYAYADLETTRAEARLLCRRSGVRSRRRMISEKGMRRLFRIVCRFNPAELLEIGSDYGPSTAAMLLPRSDSRLVRVADLPAVEAVCREVNAPLARRITETATAADAIAAYGLRLDSVADPTAFVLVNAVEPGDAADVADGLLRLPAERKVIIVRNMAARTHRGTRLLFDRIKSSVAYGMTFFNDKTAIAVIDPRLPRQGFSLWF